MDVALSLLVNQSADTVVNPNIFDRLLSCKTNKAACETVTFFLLALVLLK